MRLGRTWLVSAAVVVAATAGCGASGGKAAARPQRGTPSGPTTTTPVTKPGETTAPTSTAAPSTSALGQVDDWASVVARERPIIYSSLTEPGCEASNCLVEAVRSYGRIMQRFADLQDEQPPSMISDLVTKVASAFQEGRRLSDGLAQCLQRSGGTAKPCRTVIDDVRTFLLSEVNGLRAWAPYIQGGIPPDTGAATTTTAPRKGPVTSTG